MSGRCSSSLASVCALALAVAAMPVFAATMELQRKAMPSGFWSSAPKSPEARREFAVGLLDYWKAVSERIPRLPPKELEWIRQELSTSDPLRLTAALNRKEGSLYMAADTVDFCVDVYRSLIPALAKGGRVEALAWVHSLRCYSSTADLPDQLYRAGLISQSRSDQEIKMQFFSIWQQGTLRAIESSLAE